MADELPGWMTEAIGRFNGEVTTCPPRTFSTPAGYTMSREEALAMMKRQMGKQNAAYLAAGRARGAAIAAERGSVTRTLVAELAESEPLSIAQIAARLNLGKTTVAKHLKAAGIATARARRADIKPFRVTVSLCARTQKWRAVVWTDGKYHALKYHDTKEAAQAAVEAFREKT
jgi:hypothetical protein